VGKSFYLLFYYMHLKLECLPDMGGKVTLNVLAYGIIPFWIWETIYGEKTTHF
jgi:hypothetical protein